MLRNSFIFLALLAACGRNETAHPNVTLEGALKACPDCPARQYQPSDGFVVHEWGTFTSVLGSDGSSLPGLHHEEEDLPGFVADRVAQVQRFPSSNPTAKMETPVTYFYAPEETEVSASVSFPNGLLTQWFPYVRYMWPPVYDQGGQVLDPWLSSSMSAAMPASCASHFNQPLRGGLLDWSPFRVLGPNSNVTLAGPVGDLPWKFARATNSNALQVDSPEGGAPQFEKFLFYRGLGDFSWPIRVTTDARDEVTFGNDGPAPLGKVLLMNVTTRGGAFVSVGDVATSKSALVPTQLRPLPDFVAALKAELMRNLIADGLYTDEARAMVDTWERSYFLTPGVRALYLLDQAQTDAIIPLVIAPTPRVTKRTMVIRLELLTKADEARLSSWLTQLADPATAATARAWFLGLGRFAEPHLTRALALSTSRDEMAAASALLTEIRGVRRWAPVSAEQ